MSGSLFVYLAIMAPSDIKNKRILISPLNWGMGHVSRCIGLIDQLISQENEIVIACNEDQKLVFLEYFPNAEYVNHEGYPFKFSGSGRFGWDIITRFSALSKRLRNERKEVKNYVIDFNIDVVLSDHRYGFRSRHAKSIFITHQFNLPLKWFEVLVAGRHRKLMFKFKEIWIIDTEEFKFAGKLSVFGGEKQVTYIGPYSRFSRYTIPSEKGVKNVLIISGPTVYGQQLLDEQLKILDRSDLVVIASEDIKVPEGIERSSNKWLDQDQVILNAGTIISRSGYSTIMDSDILNTPATLYSTKGQREQEYLSEYHG